MLTISPALATARAANYHKHELAADYYRSGASPASWWGKGATELGLAGPVTKEAFVAVLSGRHPATGEQLVGGSTAHSGLRRAAWDLTFAAPKSISILACIGGDSRLVSAHDRAVAAALGELERYVRCRRAKRNGIGEHTNNLVVARFRHETSRDIDPHLHSHCVTANLSLATDRWRAIEARVFFRLQRYATAVYRAELARDVRRLGYEIEIGERGAFEIAAISESQRREFSQRRQAIEAEAAIEGKSIAERGEQFKWNTRAAKVDIDRAELQTMWESRAREVDLNIAQIVDTARSNSPSASRFEQVERTLEASRDAVTHGINHVSERESAAPLTEYLTEALVHGLGTSTIADLRSEFESRRSRREFIELERGSEVHSTPEMMRMEGRVVQFMQDGQGEVKGVVARPNVRSHHPILSDEQVGVAEFVLTTTDRVVGIQADAGTGKSETIVAVAAVAKRAGFHVTGLAPFSGAVDALVQKKIEARTVESFLRGEPNRLENQLWLIDESGTLSTVQMHALLDRAREVNARVVLYGDTRKRGTTRPGQHNAVAAGDPFRLLQERGMATASLIRKWRQAANPDLERVADAAARGDVKGAFAGLRALGALQSMPIAVVRDLGVAEDFAEHPDNTLVVAPSNATRERLNSLIRGELIHRRKVAQDGVVVRTLRNRNLSEAERMTAIKYVPGNVVRYHRGSAKFGVAKQSEARVEAVDALANLVTVRLSDGTTRTYDPRRLRGVDLFDEADRELSVGDRIVFRSVVRHRSGRIANGAIARIRRIDSNGLATIELQRHGKKEEIAVDLNKVREIDLGYVTTSHASQGHTFDRVSVVIDARDAASAKLVNSTQFYVSITRARHTATIWTDDAEALEAKVARSAEKVNASDWEEIEDGEQHRKEAEGDELGHQARFDRAEQETRGGGGHDHATSDNARPDGVREGSTGGIGQPRWARHRASSRRGADEHSGTGGEARGADASDGLIVASRFVKLLNEVRSAIDEAYDRVADKMSSFVGIVSARTVRPVVDPDAEHRRRLFEVNHEGMAVLLEARSSDAAYCAALRAESTALDRWIAATDVSILPAAGLNRADMLSSALLTAAIRPPTPDSKALRECNRALKMLERRPGSGEIIR